MADIIKQDMAYIWATSGDITAPDNAKISEGWGIEVVPRQWWNWMQNRADSNIAYMLQKGLPEWDATTEFLANKSFVQRSGIVYRCILTGTNKDPVSEPTYWVKAFAASSAASDALATVTPAANTMPYFTSSSAAATTSLTAFARTILDDLDATAVRTTISAQQADDTLTAYANAATGANMLHYFTGTDTVGTTMLTAFGRNLISSDSAPVARTTLGLGTAAVTDSTTSVVDSTEGSSLRVGDFGLGSISFQSALVLSPSATLKSSRGTGFYRYSSGIADAPTGDAGLMLQINRSTTVASILAFTASGRIFSVSQDGAGWAANWTELFGTNNVSAFMQTVLGAANATAARTLLNAQEADATLTAIAGASTGANILHYFTGVDTVGTTTLTPFARTLLDDTDASVARTTLGLGTVSTFNVSVSQTDTVTNRILKVGDFGIGTGSASGPGTPVFSGDLNTLVVSGLYYGSTVTNGPGGSGYILVQTVGSAGDVSQTFKNKSSGIVYERYCVAGVWSSGWTQTAINADVVNKQPLDATLTAVAGVTTAANTLIYFTGVDTAAATTLTPFARTILDDADATTMKTTLSLQNVDNTSDVNKPISTATQTALDLKVPQTSSTGAAQLPTGTTANRPGTPVTGYFRFNTNTSLVEVYNGTGWVNVGSGSDGVPLGTPMWFPSRGAVGAGFVVADGQTLSRLTYPDMWTAINTGVFPVATEANWTSTPTLRASYTVGNGSSTFRIPDYNGKSSGTIGAPFLRGDGTLSNGTVGSIQQDAFQGHWHITRRSSDGSATNMTLEGGSGGAGYAAGTANTGGSQARDIITDGTNGTPRTAAETRPLNITGVWAIKLFGTVVNVGSADVAQLATDYANLASRTTSLESRTTALEAGVKRRKMVRTVLATGVWNSVGQVINFSKAIQPGDTLLLRMSPSNSAGTYGYPSTQQIYTGDIANVGSTYITSGNRGIIFNYAANAYYSFAVAANGLSMTLENGNGGHYVVGVDLYEVEA